MRIRVLTHYRGRNTGFRPIAPGEYDDHDPALYGACAQLLADDFAVPADSEAPVVIPAEPEPETAPDEKDSDDGELVSKRPARRGKR